ncbi:hypothetical protein [Chitinophaga pinensis]|uniref:Lipoprotein n=1 Tax=Chitinophaga pinensis (strain ATCC 43595 / DSM 2588 / LMG 13176 / NBRC 15968 / NCIMB 11800 / UQM 2034) TaxID=485918 RepID=A0A979G0G4_CHIPD|nr:hypothetical protein [Chitinophaga pinensis]ACU58540.1 hypothetical protein Cpin_1042 [Chitinophaga pinensis DSM 2588]
MPLKSYLFIVLAFLGLTFTSCGKKGAAEPKPEEEGLKVSLENVAEGQYTAAPGSSYTFQVKVSSKMPEKGVNVKVDVITDPGGIVFPQNPVAPSKDSVINVTLIGLEPIRTVKVTITITSEGNDKNVVVKTFWITNKSEE